MYYKNYSIEQHAVDSHWFTIPNQETSYETPSRKLRALAEQFRMTFCGMEKGRR